MSIISSSSNASLHPLPSSSSFYELVHICFASTVGVFNMITFTIISIILLLPLCILVLYLGHQRRRQQRSDTTMSHSDVFTYNMVISGLLTILGWILGCVGFFTDLKAMGILSISISVSNYYVQIFFHTLTCVERYLAVVHPVTYLSLKKANWIRFRNITTGCVWLLCSAMTGFITTERHVFAAVDSCFIVVVIIIICFCSLSVLCTLIRPRPGEGGGDRQRIDQSKLRAFYTIMAILGVLMFRFGWDVLSTTLYQSLQLRENEQCRMFLSELWMSLPSSLVSPLLFLHRAGKLPCCKNNNKTGQ